MVYIKCIGYSISDDKFIARKEGDHSSTKLRITISNNIVRVDIVLCDADRLNSNIHKTIKVRHGCITRVNVKYIDDMIITCVIPGIYKHNFNMITNTCAMHLSYVCLRGRLPSPIDISTFNTHNLDVSERQPKVIYHSMPDQYKHSVRWYQVSPILIPAIDILAPNIYRLYKYLHHTSYDKIPYDIIGNCTIQPHVNDYENKSPKPIVGWHSDAYK